MEDKVGDLGEKDSDNENSVQTRSVSELDATMNNNLKIEDGNTKNLDDTYDS